MTCAKKSEKINNNALKKSFLTGISAVETRYLYNRRPFYTKSLTTRIQFAKSRVQKLERCHEFIPDHSRIYKIPKVKIKQFIKTNVYCNPSTTELQ